MKTDSLECSSNEWDLEKAIKFLSTKAGRKLTREMEKSSRGR